MENHKNQVRIMDLIIISNPGPLQIKKKILVGTLGFIVSACIGEWNRLELWNNCNGFCAVIARVIIGALDIPN